MKILKKEQKAEIKRMRASFLKETSKTPKLDKCLTCKQDAGKNFVFKYKKNNQLKGKICISCYHKVLTKSS